MLQALLVSGQGSWQVVQKMAGIASMHAAVNHYDQCILLDRTNIGPSRIRLPGGRCRNQPLERISKKDCYAHSVMLNPANGAVRPLFIYTDTWCSSGQFFANGVLWQTGGDFEGNRKIRTIAPGGKCDWVETNTPLTRGRWYSTNHILPGGNRQIVIGGRTEPTYEFVPKKKAGEGAFPLVVLNQPTDNLYPFVFLLLTGDLYVFTNRYSIVLNYNRWRSCLLSPATRATTRPEAPRQYHTKETRLSFAVVLRRVLPKVETQELPLQPALEESLPLRVSLGGRWRTCPFAVWWEAWSIFLLESWSSWMEFRTGIRDGGRRGTLLLTLWSTMVMRALERGSEWWRRRALLACTTALATCWLMDVSWLPEVTLTSSTLTLVSSPLSSVWRLSRHLTSTLGEYSSHSCNSLCIF